MRLGMLIDLNTCAGCGACVMACKQGNATPNGVWWLTMLSAEEGTYPQVKKRVLPKSCMHCANAPCVRHCPTGASHRAGDGTILIDAGKCIGCRACQKACPYEVRWYVDKRPEENPYWGSGAQLTPYELRATVERHEYGKMGKCLLCHDRVEAGRLPLCVQTCITKSRLFGDLDDPESDISRAIASLGAHRLLADLGTDPSVFYAGPTDVFYPDEPDASEGRPALGAHGEAA